MLFLSNIYRRNVYFLHCDVGETNLFHVTFVSSAQSRVQSNTTQFVSVLQ